MAARRTVYLNVTVARKCAQRCLEFVSLTTALRSSVGLGGRARAFPDNNERARTAVRKALVRAVAAIETVEPDLGLHLRTSLVTGTTCRYSPAPGWSVTADARGNDIDP
jgi:hypothetical protein